jgi:hypothetical protein
LLLGIARSYLGGSVYEVAMKYLGIALDKAHLLYQLSELERDKLSNALVGMEARVIGGPGRTRRVTAIVWEGSAYTFKINQGQEEWTTLKVRFDIYRITHYSSRLCERNIGR